SEPTKSSAASPHNPESSLSAAPVPKTHPTSPRPPISAVACGVSSTRPSPNPSASTSAIKSHASSTASLAPPSNPLSSSTTPPPHSSDTPKPAAASNSTLPTSFA